MNNQEHKRSNNIYNWKKYNKWKENKEFGVNLKWQLNNLSKKSKNMKKMRDLEKNVCKIENNFINRLKNSNHYKII